MNSDKKELLSCIVFPVIPSNGISAHALALRLYLRYGVCSTLCGHRKNILDLLDPFCSFLRAPYSENGDLTIRLLKDFSEEISDYIPILVPADEEDKLFIESRASELESFYIITSSYKRFKDLPIIKFA